MAIRRRIRGDLSDAQARAIGRLTVNFNWMEHAAEAIIKIIVSPHEYGLADPLIEPMRFAAKLDVLKRLVESLSEHYVPTPENERAYQRFSKGLKDLIAEARGLNTFRNSIIHWRSFLTEDTHKHRFKIDASAKTIEAKSEEMGDVGTKFFAYGLFLRKGDYSLTFGTHVAKSPQD
jgi:hypothetical protein